MLQYSKTPALHLLIMEFFKNRTARKELKDIRHHARHIRHMYEDIADPELLVQLKTAEAAGKSASKGDDAALMESAGKALYDLCKKIAPPRPLPKVRENVEVLFVAIAAAMAIRAYCFQPYKIPTGSMQPTLYGITLRPLEQQESSALLVRVAKFFWKGEVFLNKNTFFDRMAKGIAVGPGFSATAHADGYIRTRSTSQGVALDYRDNFDAGQTITIFIGDTPHRVSRQVAGLCRYGEYIKKGQSILRGVAKAGDYILVNRMKYNFFPPKRGDIVVFDAEEATGKAAYYIKRMVGLPGETISVAPPYLMVNGHKTTDSRFDKLFTSSEYSGYVYGSYGAQTPPLIGKAGDSIMLADDEYLFFGDNTENSLDGRYFGAVDRDRIIGSAFFVGLPFDRAGRAETWH